MGNLVSKARLLELVSGGQPPTLILQDIIETALGGRSSPSRGIGYETGAGFAVTQGTSRSTTVVADTVCGKITTTADSLAAATIVTFTVTCAPCAATDVVVVSKVSGDVDTHCWVNSVAAGSFTVSLRNTHASGADTTAFVLNFAIIRSVVT